MKTTTIRELKHDTTTVLGWVAGGETVEVRRRNVPVALLSPPQRRSSIQRPDFAARLRAIYGTKVLRTTSTDLIAESRGTSLQPTPTPGSSARSLDILHVAAALTLGLAQLLTFDARQAALARAAGLKAPSL